MGAIALVHTALVWPPTSLVEHEQLELANEMISMIDAVAACQAEAERLVLQLCSVGLRGRTADLAHSLCTELSVISAKAQQLTRFV
jgi:hypothetical protein